MQKRDRNTFPVPCIDKYYFDKDVKEVKPPIRLLSPLYYKKGYKKIETGVVEGFNKVSDKCVEVLFAKEGESVEDAKKRLSREDSTEKQTESDNEN